MNLLDYDDILKRCLDKIPDDIDKREGSLIFLALAPICYELSTLYFELNNTYLLSNVHTAIADALDLIVNQFGVYRKKATKSIRLCEFLDYNEKPLDVPIKSKFFDGQSFYIVTEKISNGKFYVECQSYGSIGNKFFGEIDTCQYIKDLYVATLKDIIVSAYDLETDDELRNRFKVRINSRRFGGNISDYKDFTLNIDKVYGVKVKPHFFGAGTVLLIIVGENYLPITSEVTDEIQEQIDPINNSGKGIGIAPIGHTVTVKSANGIPIDIRTNIIYKDDWNYDNIKPYIDVTLDNYLLEIRKKFNYSDELIVRISQIESRLLLLDGILDINNTTINNSDKNLILKDDNVPIRGNFFDTAKWFTFTITN